MAIQFWRNMSILEGGVEFACHGKNVNLQVDVEPLNTTALCVSDDYETLIGGLKSASGSMELMQDLTTGTIDETAWANFGTADVVRSIVTAADDGSAAYLMRGLAFSYSPISNGDVGSLAMATMQHSTSGVLVRGKLLHPSNVSRTSSSTGTGRQLGAVVAGKKMYAALHVLSASGTSPTLDVIVQSDDNSGFTSPTTRITFSQATGATSAWGSVDGAVTDDYWRVSYTIGGSDTPTFAFAVTAGIL